MGRLAQTLGLSEDPSLHYSQELIDSLQRDYEEVQEKLQYLLLEAVQSAETLSVLRAKEHLIQGVGRRLKTIRRSLDNVFRLYPPSLEVPLDSGDLEDVQINLHAFVINIYGLFENLAWSFVLRHGLEREIGKRTNIGLFIARTQRHLPSEIKDYITSSTITAWHTTYLKNYRDSLAHRIPLYVPPATFTPDEGEQYRSLEIEKISSIRDRNWGRIDNIYEEQAALGKPCPVFLHLLTETEEYESPVYLHPQMFCDVKTIIEFLPIFLSNWARKA